MVTGAGVAAQLLDERPFEVLPKPERDARKGFVTSWKGLYVYLSSCVVWRGLLESRDAAVLSKVYGVMLELILVMVCLQPACCQSVTQTSMPGIHESAAQSGHTHISIKLHVVTASPTCCMDTYIAYIARLACKLLSYHVIHVISSCPSRVSLPILIAISECSRHVWTQASPFEVGPSFSNCNFAKS